MLSWDRSQAAPSRNWIRAGGRGDSQFLKVKLVKVVLGKKSAILAEGSTLFIGFMKAHPLSLLLEGQEGKGRNVYWGEREEKTTNHNSLVHLWNGQDGCVADSAPKHSFENCE